MSFSGQSNPPWQRNSMNNVMGMGSGGNNSQLGGMSSSNSGLPFHQGSQQLFLNQQSQQTQQNMQFGHNSINSNNMNSQMSNNQMYQQGGGVSYPQPRSGLNSTAFQNSSSGGGSQQSNNMNMHGQGRQNFNSMGTVTKITPECGLVNEEVFFVRNAVKGPIPKLGDRVIFEATVSQSGQFQWTANRIQLVSQSSLNSGGGNSGQNLSSNQPPPLMSQNVKGTAYSAVPPPNEYQRNQRRSSPRRSPHLDRNLKRDRRDFNRNPKSRDNEDEENDRKKRREDHERSKERNKGRDRDNDGRRDRDNSADRRDRDRERGRSPIRRSTQKGPNIRAIPRYKVQIPKNLLSFKHASVHDLRQRYTTLYVPSDFFHADVKWSESFKPENPFSIHRPCSFHIMHKIVEPLNEEKLSVDVDDADYMFSAKVMLMASPSLTDMYQKCFDEGDNDSDHSYVHPSRLISFLVGTRGRNEPMAIGGPWSPSLDGQNPDKDPAVLIRTAIRTCKALTGIDLSTCTQWYRFLELHYYRSEYSNKGKLIPSRMETVVIYLPDINSCMPTYSEWNTLTQHYKAAVEKILNSKANAVPSTGTTLKNSSSLATAEETPSISSNAQNGTEKETDKNEPTHYSKLDLKSMKIQDIRDELTARNLSSKGLKPQVVARLAKALNAEKASDKAIEENEVITENEEEEANNTCSTVEEVQSTDIIDKKIAEKKQEESCTITIDDTDADGDNDAGIEVDMTDILILDEYDSRKNPDENSKEMNERQKQQLERRYALPEKPHIIVHPSKTAKGGKFDCSVMSLSVLLDYRPEDTKERLFEVSLFAELFNEMLMRDFGFNIYKELSLLKDVTVDEETAKKDDAKTVEDEDKSKEKSSISNDDQQPAASTDRKPNENSEKPKSDQHDRRKRNLDEDAEDDDFSVVSADRKRKTANEKKRVVVKPHLLLSFIYFDTSHCGYIFEKDLEDLVAILGLSLSRSQIRKIVGKCISRHALYYRKITDKSDAADEEEEKNISEEDVKKLALGNTALLPCYNTALVCDSRTNKSNQKKSENLDMTTYQGAVIDVGKLVSQIKRSEIALSEMEKQYSDLNNQHSELQSQHTKANNKIKDLQSELKGLNRKLSDTDRDFFLLNRKYNDHYNVLSHVYERISPIFARASEKGHKPSSDGGSKDKESVKEKESGKDKEKEKTKEKEKPKEVSENENEKTI